MHDELEQVENTYWVFALVTILCGVFAIGVYMENRTINHYERSIEQGTPLELNDARYICNKIEVKETVWKAVK